MSKLKTIDSFFKRKDVDTPENNTPLDSSAKTPPSLERPFQSPRIEPEEDPLKSLVVEPEEIPFKSFTLDSSEVDVSSLQRDPGLRPPMWDYPVNQRDEIRRTYSKMGPYQIHLSKYPLSGFEKHLRRFQAPWFIQFSSWLVYSPSKDAAYCLPCYLFTMKAVGRPGWDIFTLKGFKSWKKVNDGKKCAFLNHIGEDPCSYHNNAVKSCEDLLKQSQHIDKVMNAQSTEQILNNRLRVKTSIDVVRWLAFQGCAFRGHDETPDSKNQGNFLEMVKLLTSYNDKVANFVLENAPKFVRYTSHTIQKDILKVLASKVRNNIREDIGDSKFCIIIDEARDESKAEQMAIVLRFVDNDGFIAICVLALVAASREVVSVHEFFSNLNFIVNVVSVSCKSHDELQAAQAAQIAHMLAIDELETGKRANQIGTVKRACDSRWGSHFYSICSLVRMFGATCSVLENIIKEGSTYSQREDANAAYKMMTSFQFIFILHLMKEIMGITDVLCQALQQKSQDISNAIHLVSTTKALIQKLRDEGWDNLLENVVSFSKQFDIDIPDLSARYIEGRGRHQRDHITVEHHYHFDIFHVAIDFQLQELNSRFGEGAMELLTLSSALDPKDAYKSFNIDDICCLAEKYYHLDFSEQEKINLRFQLKHFEVDVLNHPKLQNLSSIAELCRGLIETEKSKAYHLIDRLIRLILTLPVSTATTE